MNIDQKNDDLPDYRGKCFEVFQYASHERSDMPGYFQYFEAKDPETLDLVSKVIENIPKEAQTGFGAYTDHRITIQQRTVWAQSGTGYEAIRRFREWLSNGYPVEWLIEPHYTKEINNA